MSRRTKTVLVALVGSMTVGAGAMWALEDGGPPVSPGGLTLSPLVSVAGSSSLESILRTPEPLADTQWQAIVIHHSGSPAGDPGSLDTYHRSLGLNGLGYHFVIGNGTGMGNGEIHVGARWLDQSPGAHVAGQHAEAFNRAAVGICLVGNGDRRPFTDEQVRRLAQLVALLARELDIPEDRILLHSELTRTSSPGRLFPQAAFREQVAALR